MTVLSLKTELDVAKLLLDEGWIPEDINGVLVFPLPKAAFHHLGIKNDLSTDSDVVTATRVTPTTLYRAKQLLESAGWLDHELDSLLKPCVYSFDPWATQTIHDAVSEAHSQPLKIQPLQPDNLPPLEHHRLKMALKRIISLLSIITLTFTAVLVFG